MKVKNNVWNQMLSNIFISSYSKSGELGRVSFSHRDAQKKKEKSHQGKVAAFENSLFSAKLLIHICKKIKASLWRWP